MVGVCYLPDILQGDWLPAAGIVGDGDHSEGDILPAHLLDEAAQFLQIHVALEGVPVGRVKGFVDDQVGRVAASGADIGIGGIKMHVGWHVLPGFDK